MRFKKIIPITRFVVVLLLVLASIGNAQDFQIRTHVDLVVVPVTVEGHDDEPVTGLKKEDFIVREDGKVQTVTNFTNDPVPISAAFVIDTGLSDNSFSQVQASIAALLDAFTDTDEIAVYGFDRFSKKLMDFTVDKLRFESTLRSLKDAPPDAPALAGGGPFSASGPMINGAPIVPASQLGLHPAATPAKDLDDAIFLAAGDLATRPPDRRKIILVVSNGQSHNNDHSYDETLNRLLDQDIQVYAVGMDNAYVSRKLTALSRYTDSTGGNACYVNSQAALEKCYNHSADEARNQYILGYVSTNKVTGKVSGRIADMRIITVQLNRKGYQVRHRKGYFLDH